jgi:hypothetical protein
VGDTTVHLTFANASDDDSTFVLAIGITMPSGKAGVRANAGLFS